MEHQIITKFRHACNGARLVADILDMKCVGCGKQPQEAYYIDGGEDKCASCLDDELEKKTGCRYGKAVCNHEDCARNV